MIIIKACQHLSQSVISLNSIQCLYRTDTCKFSLVSQHWYMHLYESIGTHCLWVRCTFSYSMSCSSHLDSFQDVMYVVIQLFFCRYFKHFIKSKRCNHTLVLTWLRLHHLSDKWNGNFDSWAAPAAATSTKMQFQHKIKTEFHPNDIILVYDMFPNEQMNNILNKSLYINRALTRIKFFFSQTCLVSIVHADGRA